MDGCFDQVLSEECRNKFRSLIEKLVLDPVLNIPNRNYLEVFITRELKLGVRMGCGMHVVFMDVDGLKRINDELGHKAGDMYLKKVVDVCRKSVRESDLMVRWGGDEFFLLLYTDFEGALLVVDRIRNKLEKEKFVWNCREYRLSVSFGVARVTCDHGDLRKALEKAIKEADRLMYEEKRRKRVDLCDG